MKEFMKYYYPKTWEKQLDNDYSNWDKDAIIVIIPRPSV